MRLGCAVAALSMGSVSTMAQEADHQVLVMKRQIAKPVAGTAPSPAPGSCVSPDYSGCEREWSYGEWSEWTSTCSASATRNRQASCTEIRPEGPITVSDLDCNTEERDPLFESAGIYSGCEPAWEYGTWGYDGIEGAKSSTCSAAPQQTRTASCMVLTADGYAVRPEAECGAVDDDRTLGADYAGCTYTWSPQEWGDWSSSCSETATRSRVTLCIRELDSVVVSSSNCDAGHVDSRTQESGSNMTGCGGEMKNGSFEDGFTDWSNIAAYGETTTDAYIGTKAALLTDGSARLSQTPIVTVPVGAKITFSLQCKKIGTSNAFRAQITGAGINAAPIMSCGTGQYTEQKYIYTATQAATSLYIRFYASSSGANYAIAIDDIRLTVN